MKASLCAYSNRARRKDKKACTKQHKKFSLLAGG
jgi:hypothetical protein